MPHIFGFPSAVDHASELALAVSRGAKAPALEFGGQTEEDLAVWQTLALQCAMAPGHELFRPLVEKCQHLIDEPGRLGMAQPRRAHQIGDEVCELGQARHDAISSD